MILLRQMLIYFWASVVNRQSIILRNLSFIICRHKELSLHRMIHRRIAACESEHPAYVFAARHSQASQILLMYMRWCVTLLAELRHTSST